MLDDRNTNGALGVRGIFVAPFAKAHARPDEWFILEVTADGNHLVTKIGGRIVTEFFNEKHRSVGGHIALELPDPRTVVAFRKIEIKELDAQSVSGSSRNGVLSPAQPPSSGPPLPPADALKRPLSKSIKKVRTNGFVSLFNRKDLSGWKDVLPNGSKWKLPLMEFCRELAEEKRAKERCWSPSVATSRTSCCT